ncbi:MAG TPA: hypothetical protein VJJ98_07210 [Sedimentisphaerales bacterium]|nr:hypothetical protein [Sedimentisphaerales bacterium]
MRMSNRLSNVIWAAAAAAALIAGGCAVESDQGTDKLAVGPAPDSLKISSEEAGVAIQSAGGLDAWAGAKEIQIGCVATFYQEDGSYYLTEQLYEVFPWSNSVRISGREPGGEYAWEFQGGRLAVLQGESEYDGLQVGVDNGCIAEGILNLITAPARLLDEGVDSKWSAETVKLEGQWYRPIKRAAKAGVDGAENLRDSGFYQKGSTGRVDMALMRCGGPDVVLIVRGYDYTLLGKDGVMIPSKIEAYKADQSGTVRHRIIQIDVGQADVR